MEFRRLKASIVHNEQEAPSIYLAICAIESLVYDIEDEADQVISACPIGDDTLPSKLAWLCNTIIDIYNDNSEEMVRNRDRLSAAMEKLKKVGSELSELADVTDHLAKVRKKLDVQQSELDEARENKRKYDALNAKCADAEEQLRELRRFEPEKEQERLQSLRNEIFSLENRQSQLRALLDEANAKLKVSQDMHDARQNELEEVTRKTTDYNRNIHAILDAIAQETKAGEQAAARMSELEEKKRSLIAERERQNGLANQAQEQIDTYRVQVLEPIQKRIAETQDRLAELEEERKQAESELETICQKRDCLINRIAEIRELEPKERDKLAKKERQLIDLTSVERKRSAELTDLCAKLDALTDQLSSLQDQVSEFEQDRIPTQEKRVADETARASDLEHKLQNLEEQERTLLQNQEALEAKIQDVSERLQTYQDLYDTLTADYGAKNSELQNLEKKLNDMKDKTDVQKHALYKKQLEDSIKEARRIQDECEAMETELQSTRAQLEEKRSRYENLKEQTTKAAEVEAKINLYLNELEPVVTQGFLAQLEEMEKRLNQLSFVRNNLHKSLVMMGEILGEVPVPDDGAMLVQLNDIMQKMQSKIKQIRNDVAMCAKSVRLEEQ